MLIRIFTFLLLSQIALSISANTRRYRLSLRDDPSTSVVIGWEQDGGSGAVVYYGTIDYGTNWSSYNQSNGVDRTVSAEGMDNSFARLSNLMPDTKYYFVIKDSDGVSPRFWFKTTPMGNAHPLSIIAGGDSRAYLDNSPRQKANRMVAKLRPDLVMFGGDYTWLSTSLEWSGWMDDWQLTHTSDGKMVPVLWERGNHELSSGIVNNLFDIPSTDEYYAISVGGDFLRIYTLNTEISIAGNQTTWLENDLQTNSDNHDWNIAQYHTCMRPHTTHKTNGDQQYNSWAQLFYDYRVQLIVESDAHDVKTTWPVRPSTGSGSEDGFILDSIRGSVYIGEGCWGAPLRTNDWNKSWTRNSGSFNSFHWMKIGKDTIEIRTVKTDNASSVGSVTDNDKFTPPSGIDIWNPSNGAVVYITNEKYTERPDVDVTYPFHRQFFGQPQNILITADASDVNGSVQQVLFYINDVLIGQDNSFPYDYNWTIPSDGAYTITAWAVDNDGWHNVSDDVKIYAGEIDITASLLSDNDDAEEYKDDGSVDLSSSDLELCIEEWIFPISDEDQWVGLRFDNLEIPRGASVIQSYIQFTADENQSGSSNLAIYGEAQDDAAPFSTLNGDLSNRIRTTTTINWPANSWSSENAGLNEQTPDLAPIVQELVNRSNWTMGNAMAFLIEGTGTRSAYSRDENVSKSAKLHITYTHSGVVSIEDITDEKDILIYPNPTHDWVRIEVANSAPFAVEIYNLEGKNVYRSEENYNSISINCKQLNMSSGVYLFRIGNITQQVIIN